MTLEEEIKFQTNFINERLRNVQIFKLAIEALVGDISDNNLSLLLDITTKINAEKSSIEMADTIITNLKKNGGKIDDGKSI